MAFDKEEIEGIMQVSTVIKSENTGCMGLVVSIFII